MSTSYGTLNGEPPRRYEHLLRAVRETRARRILEIGTWNGLHAAQMIESAGEFHPVCEIEYHGFDLFDDMTSDLLTEEFSKNPPSRDEVWEQLRRTGARITLHRGNTRETLPKAQPGLPPMDVIFIDGGHSLVTIQSDWTFCERLLHRDSVVLFDDYYRDRNDLGCKHIVEGIDSDRYDVAILEPCDVFQLPEGLIRINMVQVKTRGSWEQ